MKINSRKKFLTSAVAVTLSVATIAAGTAFYMNAAAVDADSMDSGITLTLSETKGNPVKQADGSVINTGFYNIIPATSQEKDPTVKIQTNSEAYVFILVEDNTDGLVNYSTTGSGWTAIDKTKFSSGVLSDNQTVYYRIASENTDTTYQIFDNNTVSYSNDIENEQLLSNDGTIKDNLYIQLSAKAIETRIVPNTVTNAEDKAVYAYEHFNDKEIEGIHVTSSQNWSSAINTAESSTAESVTIYVEYNYETSVDFSNIKQDLVIEGQYDGQNKKISSSNNGSQVKIAGTTGGRTVTINNFTIENDWTFSLSNDLQMINMAEENSTLILNNVSVIRSVISWHPERRCLSATKGTTILTGNTNITSTNSSWIVGTPETAIYVGIGATVIVDENMTGTITGTINVKSGGTLQICGGTFINSGLTYSKIKSYVGSDYEVKAYNNASTGNAVTNPNNNTSYTRYVVTKK